MKKLRYFYWLAQSFVKKHYLIILAAALVGAISFNQSTQIIKLLPKPKRAQYIGRVVFDSNLSSLPRDIQRQISDGLTTIEEDGTPVPNLAESWQVIDNGKTYIFTLKPDLYWQDGTPLLASDIQYSFKDVEIESPDESTIIFRLKEPFAPFPNIVSQPIFKRTNTSILQLYNRTNIVGTGEFRITKLSFNGNYLKQINLESTQQKIIYRFYNTEKAARVAFKLAEVDVIQDLSEVGELADWSNVEVESKVNFNRYAAIYFNTNSNNLFDKSLRQALAYTVPGKPEDKTRAIGPLSPNSWAYNPKVKPYDYSLETAQDLVSDLKTDFELELTTTPSYQQLAEEIKESWEQLGGLTVKLKVVNFPDTTNFEALLIGQQIPEDPDQYLLWHSTQPTNITGYQNAKVDKLLEDGRKEIDQSKRKETYLDFQRFLVEDTPATFLFHLNSTTIRRK